MNWKNIWHPKNCKKGVKVLMFIEHRGMKDITIEAGASSWRAFCVIVCSWDFVLKTVGNQSRLVALLDLYFIKITLKASRVSHCI